MLETTGLRLLETCVVQSKHSMLAVRSRVTGRTPTPFYSRILLLFPLHLSKSEVIMFTYLCTWFLFPAPTKCKVHEAGSYSSPHLPCLKQCLTHSRCLTNPCGTTLYIHQRWLLSLPRGQGTLSLQPAPQERLLLAVHLFPPSLAHRGLWTRCCAFSRSCSRCLAPTPIPGSLQLSRP